MSTSDAQKELDIFHQIVSGLAEFDRDTQLRLLQSVVTFLQLSPSLSLTRSGSQAHALDHHVDQTPSVPETGGAGGSVTSPKKFLFDKQPKSDIERVVCIAYYLAHFGGMPQFKTFDISKLNTEAAQQKFSNAAYAVTNAYNRGLIVAAGGGKKQLSATGEAFVEALPDREAAKRVLDQMRHKRSRKAAKKQDTSKAVNSESVQ